MLLTGGSTRARRAALCLSGLLIMSTVLCVISRAAETDKKAADEKVYEVGGEIKPPKLVHVIEPDFDTHSEDAFVAGAVKIQIVVTKAGIPTEPKVLAGISKRQDDKAVEAVRQWRFTPATKGESPVNVRVTVEVDFHLL